MTPEMQRKSEELFDAALRLPPQERAAFLASACTGQSELLMEVESLLRYHEASSDTLKTPSPQMLQEFLADGSSATPTDGRDTIDEALPSVAGYEILGIAGRGGMGVVYRARHLALNRIVALKMIRGAAQADFGPMGRFRREAEAVARLQHPNIVQVHEAGEHAQLPFISLEYVDGGSLAQKLRTAALPARHCAVILQTLATAMHHAHSNGIVHRDLKPANVLLTQAGVPKITDFGLAKCLEGGSDTKTGAIMGTPSYMAPEQARGQVEQMGPTTDVYALGATLYEMLTGRPPFKADSDLETIVQVGTHEPVAPRQLQPNIPRDLETICLKCLQKDPSKRYGSAQALADDLGRFLRGEPIVARPVGRPERLWRWCRRNPMVAGLTAAVVLIALAGFAGVAWQAQRATTQRDKAEANFNVALESTDFLHDIAIEELRNTPGVKARTWESVLRRIEDNYDRLVRQAGETTPILAGKGKMLNSFCQIYLEDLSDTRRSLESARAAVEVYDRLLKVDPARRDWQVGHATAKHLLGTALAMRGQLTEGHQALEEAMDARKRLVEQAPDNLDWQYDLAVSHRQVAVMAGISGNLAKAEESVSAAIAILEGLSRQPQPLLKWRIQRADMYRKRGDHRTHLDDENGARADYQKAAALGQELLATNVPDLRLQLYQSATLRWHGERYQERGNVARAADAFEAARVIADRYVKLDPDNSSWRTELVEARVAQANLRKEQDLTAALRDQVAILREEFVRVQADVRKDPDHFLWQTQLALLRLRLAQALVDLASRDVATKDNLAEARTHLEANRAFWEGILTRDKNRAPAAFALLITYKALHDVMRDQDEPDAAKHALDKGLNIVVEFYEERNRQDPRSPAWQEGLAKAHLGKGMFALMSSDLQTAPASVKKARELYEQLAEKEPGKSKWLRGQVKALNAEKVFFLFGDAKKKTKDIETVLHLRERIAALEPANAEALRDLASSYDDLAQHLAATDDENASQSAFTKYLDVQNRVCDLDASDPLGYRGDRPDHVADLFRRGTGDNDRRRLLSGNRDLIEVHERLYKATGSKPRLIDAYARMIPWLDPTVSGEASELSWALRRGLNVIRQATPEEKSKMHSALVRLIPFFEANVQKRRPTRAKPFEEPVQKALDELDYRRAGELLLDQNRADAFVEILDQEAKSAHAVAWLHPWLYQRIIEVVVLQPMWTDLVMEQALAMEKSNGLSPEGRKLLASLAWHAGHADHARRLAPKESLKLDENFFLGMANAVRNNRQHEAVSRMLEHWVVVAPKEKVNPTIFRMLAFSQAQAGQLDKARKNLDISIKHFGADAPFNQQATTLIYLKDVELCMRGRQLARASVLIEKELAKGRLNATEEKLSRHALATIHAELGAHAKAEEQINAMLKADPEDPDALNALAEVFADQRKNLPQAEALVRKALSAKAGHPHYQANLGWILAQQKQVKEGLALMEKVATDANLAKDVSFLANLGDAYLLANQPGKARETWEKALRLIPATSAPDDRRKLSLQKKLKG